MKKLASVLVLISVFMLGCGSSDKKKDDKAKDKPAVEKKTDDVKK